MAQRATTWGGTQAVAAPKPKPRIRARSVKRAADERRYNERIAAVKAEMNEWGDVCPVALHLWGRALPVEDCHHKRGREGKLLLAEAHWLFVSRVGHNFIHANPGIARANGWLE